MRSDRVGYLLHPVDLAINKLLALVGRDEPRDDVDVHDAMDRILPLGALHGRPAASCPSSVRAPEDGRGAGRAGRLLRRASLA